MPKVGWMMRLFETTKTKRGYRLTPHLENDATMPLANAGLLYAIAEKRAAGTNETQPSLGLARWACRARSTTTVAGFSVAAVTCTLCAHDMCTRGRVAYS